MDARSDKSSADSEAKPALLSPLSVEEDVSDDWIAVKPQLFQGRTSSDGRANGDESAQSVKYGFSVGPGEVASQVAIALSEINSDSSEVLRHWQSTCSFSSLEDRHSIISSLVPAISSLLPPLPREPTGLLSYFSFGVRVPDGTYALVTNYLDAVLRICGLALVTDVFFDAQDTVEQYVQDMSELNQDRLEQRVAEATQEWEDVLNMRTTVSCLDDVISWYSIEGEAVKRLERAELRLYEFMKRPYSDLKEIAQCEKERSLQLSLDVNLPVAARIAAASDEDEAQTHISEASRGLLELREQRYQVATRRTAQRIHRMLEDKDRFCANGSSNAGKWISTGACATLRFLERKMVDCTVEFLHVRCKQLQADKDALLLEITVLEDGEDLCERVEACLRRFYALQLQLLEVRLQLLDEREKQVKNWLEDVPPEDTAERERLNRREGKLGSTKSHTRIEMVSASNFLLIIARG